MNAVFTTGISEGFQVMTSCDGTAQSKVGRLAALAPRIPPPHNRANAHARALKEFDRHLDFPFPLYGQERPLEAWVVGPYDTSATTADYKNILI